VILAARQICAIACLKIKNLNEFQWKHITELVVGFSVIEFDKLIRCHHIVRIDSGSF
jgi:hypothetical protein